MTVSPRLVIKSPFNTPRSTSNGRTRAATPTMATVLNRFEPTTFPIAIAEDPFRIAAIVAKSSGAPVPAATRVSPMIVSLIPSSSAREIAPVTSSLAPSHRPTIPTSREMAMEREPEPLASCSTSSVAGFFLPLLSIMTRRMRKERTSKIPADALRTVTPSASALNIRYMVNAMVPRSSPKISVAPGVVVIFRVQINTDPNTSPMLKIFDPITFPMLSPDLSSYWAIKETSSSGSEVPAATTVMPIKSGDTLKRIATSTAP